MIQFVTTYRGMHLNVFLVIDQGKAFLVCYQHETDEYGYMCPCCMFSVHHQDIMRAVNNAVSSGKVTGKVQWCCHKGDADYGDRLSGYELLNQDLFEAGSAMEISAETKALLREEALRQVAMGAIVSISR